MQRRPVSTMALTDRFAAGRENDAGNPAPSDGAALAYATSGDMHRRVKPKHVPAFAVVAAICAAISGGCKPDHGRHGRPGESVASCESGRRRQGETKDPALSGRATNAEAPAKKDKTASKPDSKTGPAKLQHGETRTLTLPGGAKMEMIYVAPGSFTMGSPRSEKGRAKSTDETQHRVTLTKGFWLGKYEVTQAQWKSVMGSNPSGFKGDNLPVENVSWNDCQEFIRKVNAEAKSQFGGEARLPTEAEWEYACRAGSAGAYAGTGNINTMGWYRGNSGKKTHPAGRMRSNAWGFYDMHGNVWEWCSDWYGSYAGGSVTDPAGPASGKYRILRGGCWLADARGCRSATRLGLSPDKHYWDDGFRLACSAEPGGQGAEQ